MQQTMLPGYSAALLQRPSEPTPLRSDVAGFVGRTRRGPIGLPVRVEGSTDAQRQVGGLDARFQTPYALRGYFENSGQVAHVIRLGGAGSLEAKGVWHVGDLDPGRVEWVRDAPSRGRFAFTDYVVEATSPGEWANGMEVTIVYRALGVAGAPEVDVRVVAPDGSLEVFPGLAPRRVAKQLLGSSLIRLKPMGPEVPEDVGRDRGPLFREWRVELQGGTDVDPTLGDYLQAVDSLLDIPEVAILTVPDLHVDLVSDFERTEVVAALLRGCAPLLDRMAVIDVPPEQRRSLEASRWVGSLRALLESRELRAGAVYHPGVAVRDPLGGPVNPVRDVPASGHVAGVISRLDRELGANHTPANATVLDAVDLALGFDEAEEVNLYRSGVNLLRCSPGRGAQVWGGRTLDPGDGRFVAHRRLVHRLVRAIRRVADPLAFDVNGPELWLSLVRAITTVLLEAFRAGALKGSRPQEAFVVRCDETTNPPYERDLGRVLCEISVAPAAPMEFIHLTLSFGQEGRLEVVEA